MIYALMLSCAAPLNLPDAGDLEGYTTGEIRSYRTSYCGRVLQVDSVPPASVLSVVYCDDYTAGSACAADPAGRVYESAGALNIECPPEYDGRGYARIYFLMME